MGGIGTFGSDNYITFQEEGHHYFNPEGQEYSSVSKKLNSIQEPFDRQGISLNMARGQARKSGRSVQDEQVEILSSWDKNLNDSLDKGNWIHDGLENFHKLGTCDPKLDPVVKQLKPLYNSYFKVYTEVLLFDRENMVAGQTDLVVQRQKGMTGLFDFYDYKTNQKKGIQFDSIGRKKDPWKHYNKFFLPPFEHLEDCNYNRYSLQLSMYALMAVRLYGIKVGKLAMIFVDNNLRVRRFPVPYMMRDAEVLLSLKKELKPLPAA